MTLVATPEGPVTIGAALEAQMRTTGYVSSVNGKQGAVTIDLGAVLPPSGTPDGNSPRAKAGGVLWKTARIDVTDWCKCDGVTDDTANVFTMLKHAASLAASTGQCTVYNPGLPIAISGTVYIPRYVNFIGEGGGGDAGIGARFLAIGAQAQVVIHERAGKSGPWLFDGNNIADPAAHPVVVNCTNASSLLTVTTVDGVAATDAALDALWGKLVTLSDLSLGGDGLFQSVIVATPGNPGYTGTVSLSGKVRMAGAVGATASGVSGWFGENVFVHMLKPSQRQLDNVSVIRAISAVAMQIDKSSNLTTHNLQVTTNRFDGLQIGRNGAAAVLVGQTHLAGNGRRQLVFRDDLGSAALAVSRNVYIEHLIAETLGCLGVRVVEQASHDRLTLGHLSITMNGVIPAFAFDTQYSEIPQFNGVGPVNIVDYTPTSGPNNLIPGYYQVLKGAGTFTPAGGSGLNPDADTARWERVSDAVALWHFGTEPTAAGYVRNTLNAATVAIQGATANRCYGFDADSDSTSTPQLYIGGMLYGQNLTAKIRWNSATAPRPVIAAIDEVPSIPLIVGAGANNGVIGFTNGLTDSGVKTANYTAIPNQIVRVNAASGALTVTLPTAPADRTRMVVKKLDTTANAVNITVGGSDVFNKSGGSTTISLTTQFASAQMQYVAAGAIWVVVASDPGAGVAYLASPAFTGTPTAPTQTAADNSTKLATTAYVDTGLGLKVPTSRLLTAGYGLTALGDLSADRTPAVALTTDSGSLAADVTLNAASLTLLFTTASLAIGKWWITCPATFTSAGAANIDLTMQLGTATATFSGAQANSCRVSAGVAATATVSCMVTVTVAGTITISAYASAASTARKLAFANNYANATGYTAIRPA